MKSYQSQVLDALEAEAIERKVPISDERGYANAGTLIVGYLGSIIFTMAYQFQSGGKNMFLFNGAEHGPATPDRYYFSSNDNAEFNRLRARFVELLESGAPRG